MNEAESATAVPVNNTAVKMEAPISQPVQPVQTTTKTEKGTDWPLINLIGSIITLVLSFCGLLFFPPCFCSLSLMTLITSIIVYSKTKDKKAIIGIVLSVIGIIICIMGMALGAVVATSLQNSGAYNNYYKY